MRVVLIGCVNETVTRGGWGPKNVKKLLDVIYGWSLACEERGCLHAVLDGLVVEPEALRRVA